MQERWLARIAAQPCDGLLISGDIAEGHEVVACLQQLTRWVSVPIFFVLGNHDFYGSSIGQTGQAVIRACREHDRLHYLTDLSAIPLNLPGSAPGTYLVGEDAWGDATEGNYEQSYVRLNDFVQIEDFRSSDPADWKAMLCQFGSIAAQRLSVKLRELPSDAKRVIVLTHVPPFREACWYEGRTTDDNWAPFFVCGQVGRVLRDFCHVRPQCQCTVLCGHTHHGGTAEVEPNLTVYTGAAHYGHPSIVALLETIDGSLVMRQPDVAET
jgi:predicted phosphohydrolase